jgi:hypothetical protein
MINWYGRVSDAIGEVSYKPMSLQPGSTVYSSYAHYQIKGYPGVAVWIHTCVTLALDVCLSGQVHTLLTLASDERSPYILNSRLNGLQNKFRRYEEKNNPFLTLGIEIRIICGSSSS